MFTRVPFLSALDNLLQTSEEEVLFLVLCLLQRTQSNLLEGITEDKVVHLCGYLRNSLSRWNQMIRDSMQGDWSNQELDRTKLALMWGSVRCCPHILDISECHSMLKRLIDQLDHITVTDSGIHRSNSYYCALVHNLVLWIHCSVEGHGADSSDL